MSDSICFTFDGADPLNTAIRLRAAKDGVSEADVVQDVLRKALAPEIEEASGALPLATVIQQVMQANSKCA
jgi:plasmid stability protein